VSRKTTNYKITVPDNDDFIDIETVSDAIEEFDNILFSVETNAPVGAGAGFHSSIYRGKYLGDTYTNKQKAAIANGSFDDLFIGDYWTINGVNWRIADFDYYYRIGDLNDDNIFTRHHVVIVPDTTLGYTFPMNSTNTTEGCYTGSRMYTNYLSANAGSFYNAFGESFIPAHKGLYSNANTSDGFPAGFTWRDMRVELMSEEQVFGHAIWGMGRFDVGTQSAQFKLFALDKTKIKGNQSYWLTTVASQSNFAVVTNSGYTDSAGASFSYGIRPFACLVGDSE